jgi:hypothetical protein
MPAATAPAKHRPPASPCARHWLNRSQNYTKKG